MAAREERDQELEMYMRDEMIDGVESGEGTEAETAKAIPIVTDVDVCGVVEKDEWRPNGDRHVLDGKEE